MTLEAIPTPRDLPMLPPTERPDAALRLAIESGMGLVTLTKYGHEWLVTDHAGMRTRTLNEWAIFYAAKRAVMEVAR